MPEFLLRSVYVRLTACERGTRPSRDLEVIDASVSTWFLARCSSDTDPVTVDCGEIPRDGALYTGSNRNKMEV